jgi:hypothetical protein
MAVTIEIQLVIVEPVLLSLGVAPVYIIGAEQAGPQGIPGLSAYEVWLAEGNVGDEQDFMESLVGEQGTPGIILFGDKLSAVDAGELGWMSIGDDYIFACTQTGTAETTPGAKDGTAIWKKAVLFQT